MSSVSSSFTSSAFSFSANANIDDSMNHTISITIITPKHALRSSSVFAIVVGSMQIISFIILYIFGLMYRLLSQVYHPLSIGKASFPSDIAVLSSLVSVPSSPEKASSPSAILSSFLSSAPASSLVFSSSASSFQSYASSLVSSAPASSLVSSSSASFFLSSAYASSLVSSSSASSLLSSASASHRIPDYSDIGPQHDIQAALSHLLKENADLLQKLQAINGEVDTAYAIMSDIVDERNKIADEADAKIRAIVAERDELIQDLEALVFDKAVLTDDCLPVASADLQVSSEEATDYSDMSLSSESDFDRLLFDVSIGAATDDSISDMSLSSESDFDSLQFDVSLDSPLAGTIAAYYQSVPVRQSSWTGY